LGGLVSRNATTIAEIEAKEQVVPVAQRHAMMGR